MGATGLAATDASAVFLGLKLYELLTLAGVFLGPIFAVLVTLWHEQRRRTREARQQVLKMLLAARGTPADPAFNLAINLIPVEFNDCHAVMTAWREFNLLTNTHVPPEREADHHQRVIVKQTTLIYQMMLAVGLKLSEGEIQTESYISQGFVRRDNLYLDSLLAMRDVADALARQTALMERSFDREAPNPSRRAEVEPARTT